MEHDAGEPDCSHPAIAETGDAYLHPAYRGRRKQDDEELLPEHIRHADGSPFENYSGGAPADDEYSDYEYGQDDGYDWVEADQYTGALGRKAAAQGYVAAQNQNQIGRYRGIDFDDIEVTSLKIEYSNPIR